MQIKTKISKISKTEVAGEEHRVKSYSIWNRGKQSEDRRQGVQRYGRIHSRIVIKDNYIDLVKAGFVDPTR